MAKLNPIRDVDRSVYAEMVKQAKAQAAAGQKLAEAIEEAQQNINARDYDPRGIPDRKEWSHIHALARKVLGPKQKRQEVRCNG